MYPEFLHPAGLPFNARSKKGDHAALGHSGSLRRFHQHIPCSTSPLRNTSIRTRCSARGIHSQASASTLRAKSSSPSFPSRRSGLQHASWSKRLSRSEGPPIGRHRHNPLRTSGIRMAWWLWKKAPCQRRQTASWDQAVKVQPSVWPWVWRLPSPWLVLSLSQLAQQPAAQATLSPN